MDWFSDSDPTHMLVHPSHDVPQVRTTTEIELEKPRRDWHSMHLIAGDAKREYCLYPIKYPNLMAQYTKHVACFWVPGAVDLSMDRAELFKLSEGEIHFVHSVLAFFASADFIVADAVSGFANEINIPEAKMFFRFQAAMEDCHSQMYGLMVETLSRSAEEQATLSDAVFSRPSVKAKAGWAEHWMDNEMPLPRRILAFALVEGIFFSASFCAVFWFRKQNKLKNGLGKSNEYISRDEGLHVQFALSLYRDHVEEEFKLSTEEVHAMFAEAVDIERSFVEDAVPVCLIGINPKLMTRYVEFVADYWLSFMGLPKLYNVENPFDFMEALSLESKSNFFEEHVSEYSIPTDQRNSENLDFTGAIEF